MRVRVIPNARQFSAAEREGVLVVRVHAKPADNAANEELEEKLGKLAGAKARVVRGAKSREKEIMFDGLPDEEAKNKIAKEINR